MGDERRDEIEGIIDRLQDLETALELLADPDEDDAYEVTDALDNVRRAIAVLRSIDESGDEDDIEE
jgi:hypothetical protein